MIKLVNSKLSKRSKIQLTFKRIHIGSYGLSISTLIPIIVLLIALLFSVGFLPINAISIYETTDVLHQTGVDTLDLNFTAEAADINITFEQLGSKSIVFRVSVEGKTGLLASYPLYDFTFHNETLNNVLAVTSKFDIAGRWPWYEPGWLNVKCDIFIDISMKTRIYIKTKDGKISMNTQAGVVLDSLDLKTTAKTIEVHLVKNVVIAGNISIDTDGFVDFYWDNVIIASDISVSLAGGKSELVETGFAPGNVILKIDQNVVSPRNVTLRTNTLIGGIDCILRIYGDVGANVKSSSALGESAIDIKSKIGFSGKLSSLTSANYPATCNFDVILETDFGYINVIATYSS